MDSEKGSERAASDSRPIALILVVDDEPDTLTTLQIVLSMLGFGVATARTAREAMHRIAEQPPDLIITDNAMPTMSGLELCQVLRMHDATKRIPIVLHTAMDLPNDNLRLYDRVITKPADLEAFLRAIDALLPPGRKK